MGTNGSGRVQTNLESDEADEADDEQEADRTRRMSARRRQRTGKKRQSLDWDSNDPEPKRLARPGRAASHWRFEEEAEGTGVQHLSFSGKYPPWIRTPSGKVYPQQSDSDDSSEAEDGITDQGNMEEEEERLRALTLDGAKRNWSQSRNKGGSEVIEQ